jgi:hypothetical protein
LRVPRGQISGTSPMMSASSGTEVRNFPSPRPSASLRVGSSPRCPRDWKTLSRISAEPEGQIPLTYTGTLPPYTPKFKRALQSLRNGLELDRRLAQVRNWHKCEVRRRLSYVRCWLKVRRETDIRRSVNRAVDGAINVARLSSASLAEHCLRRARGRFGGR